VKKYIVKLDETEKSHLQKIISSGKNSARKLTHARILLKADESECRGWKDQEIAKALDIGVSTVERVRKDFVEESFEIALNGRPQPPRNPRKVDGKVEAYLISLACSTPPEGYSYWSLRLLADQVVQADVIDSISHEEVRRTLKKMS